MTTVFYVKVGDLLVEHEVKVGDTFIEMDGKWVKTNTPEQLEEKRSAHLAKQREYYYANHDKLKAYREANRDKINERRREKRRQQVQSAT